MLFGSNESRFSDQSCHMKEIKKQRESRIDLLELGAQHGGERRSAGLDPKCSRIAALFSQLRGGRRQRSQMRSLTIYSDPCQANRGSGFGPWVVTVHLYDMKHKLSTCVELPRV